jgi:hypothetical protein
MHYNLTINKVGKGVVTPTSGLTYPAGTVVSVEAIPDAGWLFDHWNGDLTGSTNSTTITMNGNKNVIANFTITSGYTLAVTIQGSGAVMKVPDQAASYTYGQVVHVTANPMTGWAFNHWAGDLTGSTSSTNITMNRNMAATANFTQISPINNPPNTPTVPVPANGTTNILINTQLNWTCGDQDSGDTVIYTIYFGTTNPSTTKVSINQSATIYNLPTLSYSTTYYWRIIARDNHGASTIGSIWEFTTEPKPNTPPNTPSNPSPTNGETNVLLNTQLSWTSGDLDNNTVLYDVYFGTNNTPSKKVANQSALLYNPGTMTYLTQYYWTIIAWDSYNASTKGPLWEFTTEQKPNTPPNTPSNPSPSNCTTNILLNANLSWVGGDSDMNPVTYDVYFGTTSSPPKVKSNQSTLNYNPEILTYNTIYYWKIVTWDSHNASTVGPLWHYTTVTRKNGGGEPSSSPYPKKPVANASAGEPYQGLINSEILFDGSKSYDPDGNITKWFWVFGDNTNGTGKTISHSYPKAGTYSVILTVTDNEGATNTDTATCVITQPNRPSTKPIVSDNHTMSSSQKIINIKSGEKLSQTSLKTPSFELIIIIGAIAFALLWKRKSKKQN